ncbi:MAG: hypothetical protein R3Y06_08140 [Faecalibacterium sp.]
MKISKGCLNETCEANRKKTKYKKDDNFCLKCGSPLSIICVDCFCELENDDTNRCVKCKAKRDDARDNRMKQVVAAGGIVAASVKVVPEIGKTVLGLVKK